MARKKNKTFFYIALIAVSLAFLGYSFFNMNSSRQNTYAKRPAASSPRDENPQRNDLRNTPQGDVQSNVENKAETNLHSEINKDNPLLDKSGPVRVLPWQYEEDFVKAQQESNTPVLLAAYCAVLKDPLPGEESNVHHAANMVAGTVLQPGEIFSQNRELGPYTTAKGYLDGPTYKGTQLMTSIGGGVCKIASTLYNVAIQSNMKIIERHNHGMPVPYVPYGQDATVAYGVKDFKFKNNTSGPVMIWAEGLDNRLYIALYGQEKPPKVEWQHEFLRRYEAPTIYKRSYTLEKGAEKTILEGMEGAAVRSKLIITYSDGTVEERSLGVSYYNPMPHLKEKGY